MADETHRRLEGTSHGINNNCDTLGQQVEWIQNQELPRRRHSDGVDPLNRPGDGTGSRFPPHSGNNSSRGGLMIPSAPRSRPQSESDVLERRLGQELRRISDEFHMSYQQMAVARLRRDSQPDRPTHHSSSFPERRGSFIERLGEIIGLLPHHSAQDGAAHVQDDEVDGAFVPRRRARSEIIMASGLATSCFGRMDSVITDSERLGFESDTLSQEDEEERDDDDESNEQVTFSLSMDDS